MITVDTLIIRPFHNSWTCIIVLLLLAYKLSPYEASLLSVMVLGEDAATEKLLNKENANADYKAILQKVKANAEEVWHRLSYS